MQSAEGNQVFRWHLAIAIETGAAHRGCALRSPDESWEKTGGVMSRRLGLAIVGGATATRTGNPQSNMVSAETPA